jgi:hypothetical protein
MKHTLFMILLLGFGFLTPMTCSKEKEKKTSSEEQRNQQMIPEPVCRKQQMTLCGPPAVIRAATPSSRS